MSHGRSRYPFLAGMFLVTLEAYVSDSFKARPGQSWTRTATPSTSLPLSQRVAEIRPCGWCLRA
jgi:hypothetical protein